jgi:hypothetical protein
MISCNQCNTVYEDHAVYCNKCDIDLVASPNFEKSWAEETLNESPSSYNQKNDPLSNIAETTDTIISNTENEIYKIERELKKTQDEKEKDELKFVLDFLNRQMEHHREFKEKAAVLDQHINEIKERKSNSAFDFKRMFYGHGYGEKLTTTRIIGTNILMALMAISIYGIWSDFIPIPEVINIGKYLAAIFSIAFTALFILAVSTGRWKTKTKSPATQAFLSFTFIPIFFFAFFWLSFSQGLPSIYTRLIGADHTKNVIMKKVKNSSAKSCDYRLKGEIMNGAFPGYLCINKDYFLQKPKVVRVKLTGKKSSLGFYVIHLYDPPS